MSFPSEVLDAAAKSGAAIAVGRWDTQKRGKPCSEHGFNHAGVKVTFIQSWAGHIMLHLLLLLSDLQQLSGGANMIIPRMRLPKGDDFSYCDR